MRETPLDQNNVTLVAPVETAREEGRGLKKLLGKQWFPIAMMLGMAWWLWDHAAALDIGRILDTIHDVRPWQWALAVLASAGSFAAVGQYDRVLHAQLGTGISARAARRSGVVAIGLSQFLGFGALTGTLIRWRMLPELTLWQAARLSGAVALSFLAGWAMVAALAVLIFQPDIAWMKTLAALAVALAGTMAALSVYPPGPLVRLPWPSLRTMGVVVGLAAVDTLLAGTALYVLLPPDLRIAITQLLSAYLFSLGAGLVGSTPGGLGPFEATLVSLLPDLPLEPLLGGVLAFRLVYYALPAALSALVILRGPSGSNLAETPQLTRTKATPFLPPQIEVQLYAAPRAEANLLRTRDFSLLSAPDGHPLGLAAPVGQSLVMLSDPLDPRRDLCQTRMALTRAARDRFRMPALYKCGGRMAAAARRAGWKVLPTAEEALINPARFTLDGSGRRQLRRVLKKAQDAGLVIREGGHKLPLDDMSRVAAEWRANRGGERGFSMGTFSADYVACQRVFLAYLDAGTGVGTLPPSARLVAFITLHETRNEMTLDLIRTTEEAPDGAVQALVVAAIDAARAYGCPRLSLAAVPWQGTDASPLLARLRARLHDKSGAAGLRRFKAAFDPRWETLYIAAPSRLALAVAAIDIMRRITAPAPRAAALAFNPMRAAREATHKTWHLLRGGRTTRS